MMRNRLLLMLLPSIALLLPATAAQVAAADIEFVHDVVPILTRHCGKCHTGQQRQGEFSMNTRAALLEGGENGEVVHPGKSGESDLIDRLTSDDKELRMPPEDPRVSAKEVAVLKKWIDAGLTWDEKFVFQPPSYEPPLRPRRPELPPATGDRMHPLDRIIDAYLVKHKVPTPAAVEDAAFMRRASLDIVGLLPDPDSLAEFLADNRSDKRMRLIHKLLAADVDYTEHWITFWNDLLRNDYTGTGFITGGRKRITKWLYQSLLDNKPYDQFVRELIAPSPESEGFVAGIRWRGDISAGQTVEIQFSQNISQTFLGINAKCASCHDSFIDNWKLKEVYGLAAIYATKPLMMHRCDKPTGEQAQASWLFPELGQVDPEAPRDVRLKQLAALMTHPENGRLTRTVVNRVWHRLMGRGIVHPVDAMDTEPWSADVLDYLASDLADSGFDLKKTIALICTSQAYRSQAATFEQRPTADFVYRGPQARRMTAEQFVDTVWQVTGAAPNSADAPVRRFKLAGGSVSDIKPAGKWIWSYAEASSAVPKAGEAITLRKQFELASLPSRAAGVITCDNSYTLFVNGRNVSADGNWETVEIVPLGTYLKVGSNEILIVGKNGGSGPNPAGLYFEARMRDADGAETTIATDDSWQWTKSLPNAKARFPKKPQAWKSAVVVANPDVWLGRVGNALPSSLSQALHAPTRMVRASLMKSDFLMRALGRPNRDQIVTTRPESLTTLEAIDLANGQILTDAISLGAQRVVAEHGASTEELAHWLYMFTLSRGPTSGELALARQAFGPRPTEQDAADLMWILFMLPEYQLVR